MAGAIGCVVGFLSVCTHFFGNAVSVALVQ